RARRPRRAAVRDRLRYRVVRRAELARLAAAHLRGAVPDGLQLLAQAQVWPKIRGRRERLARGCRTLSAVAARARCPRDQDPVAEDHAPPPAQAAAQAAVVKQEV